MALRELADAIEGNRTEEYKGVSKILIWKFKRLKMMDILNGEVGVI